MSNLKQERLLILNMLQEDKLNIEDALGLLKTVKVTLPEDAYSNDDLSEERNIVLNMVNNRKLNSNQAQDVIKALSTTDNFKNINNEVQEKINNFTGSIENFAKDISKKTTSIIKENEPKFKKIGRTLLEKSTRVANKVSNSLSEKLKSIDKNEDNK